MGGNSPRIAVLSGKGGAGKTLVAVNLAASVPGSVYMDCDVEEPNGHLFFKPEWTCEEEVAVQVPEVDMGLCTGCRVCVDFCKFNALAFVRERPFVFEKLCHSCGGCTLLCPEKAMGERERVVGTVRRGRSGDVAVHTGILNPGEPSAIPVIRRLLDGDVADPGRPVFVDCPPGSACSVMESIRDADYCLLVAEPTVFGVHNLAMVLDLVELFGKPYGVVVNKFLVGENLVETFCSSRGAPVVSRIPFDRELGRLTSDGRIVAQESGRFKDLFASLLDAVMKEVGHETASHPQR